MTLHSETWHRAWRYGRKIPVLHWNRIQKNYKISVNAYGLNKQMLCRFCVTEL